MTDREERSGAALGQMEPEARICDYEGSDYRTAFWEGRGRDYEDGAERLALKRLLPRGGGRLLDVGAGFGRLAKIYGDYQQVILFDYSRSQLEYARAHLGDQGYIYVAGDVYQMPLADNAVDTTVMVRVLHHIDDVPNVLRHVRRVTRPQGAFVLEYANKRHIKSILRYLLGRGVNPFGRAPYEFADLHYDYHPDWVDEQLEQAGFSLGRRLSVSLFRSALLKRIFPSPLLVKTDGVLQRVTAPLALGPSIFVRADVAGEGSPEIVSADALFRCLECGHQPLRSDGRKMDCPACGATWPIEGGIHVFK